MAQVRLEHVTKRFPNEAVALDDLSLEVADGEFLILVGPSGCGKTTALRIVAGLEKPTAGRITIGDRVVNDVSPRDRDIAMVFQSYALYPHMTVYKNLAFGLKERRTPKPEIERRVRDVSGILGLDELLKRRPAQLSGGQRQRVAMGRALVREPKAFLLDEPLSNLDAKLRVQMRAELKRIHQRLGITTIYVTHDQVEAMTLGDRIVVMSAGEVQQIGRPQEVYRRPANLFVAGFIGSPPMNLLRGTAREGRVRAGDLEFPKAGVPDGDVVVGVRPEALVCGTRRDAVVRVRGRGGGAARRRGRRPRQRRGLPRVESGAEEVEELPLLVEGSRAQVVARSSSRWTSRPRRSARSASRRSRSSSSTARTGAAIDAVRSSRMTAEKPRIVIVGAGGWVFPLELTRDILSFPALGSSTLALYDIDVPAAERTADAARELIELGGCRRASRSRDLRAALEGADFVITVFQVGGIEAYALDVEIPREYGIDQTVGDTLGPGGCSADCAPSRPCARWARRCSRSAPRRCSSTTRTRCR